MGHGWCWRSPRSDKLGHRGLHWLDSPPRRVDHRWHMYVDRISNLRWLLVQFWSKLRPLKQPIQVLELLRFPCWASLVRHDLVWAEFLNSVFTYANCLLVIVVSGTSRFHKAVACLAAQVRCQLVLLAVWKMATWASWWLQIHFLTMGLDTTWQRLCLLFWMFYSNFCCKIGHGHRHNVRTDRLPNCKLLLARLNSPCDLSLTRVGKLITPMRGTMIM